MVVISARTTWDFFFFFKEFYKIGNADRFPQIKNNKTQSAVKHHLNPSTLRTILVHSPFQYGLEDKTLSRSQKLFIFRNLLKQENDVSKFKKDVIQ